MGRDDREYRNYRSNRNYGGSSRRSSSSRNSRYEKEPSGGGFTFIVLVLMIAIGAYFLSGEEKQEMVKQVANEWIGKAQAAMSQAIMPATEEEVLPSNMTPCTKANIAKIVAYTFLEDQGTKESSHPSNLWYSKYFENLKEDPKFSSFNEEEAMEVMTYREATNFFSDLLGSSYSVSVEADRQVEEEGLTLKEFLKGFEQALEHAGKKDLLQYETLSILATTSTNESLGAWEVLTDKGVYGFEGLILDPFVGYTLRTIVKDNEILGVVDTLSLQGQISNGYVVSVGEGVVNLRVGNHELVYSNDMMTSNEVGKFFNILIQHNKIMGFDLVKEDDSDMILRLTDSYIDFQKAGRLPYGELTVYDGTGGDSYTSKSSLFSGIKVVYTMKDDKVETIKVVEDKIEEDIRVLVSEDGLGHYTHEDVKVGSDTVYTLTYGDKQEEIPAGQVWNAGEFSWEIGKDKVTLVAKEGKSLEMQAISRQEKQPLYKGQLEIYKEESGYTVINQLSLEEYIAAVIPSEMPTDYGIEALKAQAIAARSFAKAQQKSSKYLKYGAQLDDTVSTQVYNNIPANEVSYKAAKETAGEVMLFNDRIISGNFFSTSCGYTANHGETWATGEIFPNNTPTYLVARQQYIGERLTSDLSNEKDADSFFRKSADEVDAFDKESPWFRWQVNMDAKELEHVINSNIYNLTTHYANMVKVKDGEKWVIGEINNIGKIKDIQISKRGEGGNIMEMIVVGEECTIKVGTEYLIRLLLAPLQKDSNKDPIIVARQDGSQVQNMALLPSAFFSTEVNYDSAGTISEMTLYGGGYGHGVGMSQNGAKGMAERGYTSKEILRHFYNGVEIKKL